MGFELSAVTKKTCDIHHVKKAPLLKSDLKHLFKDTLHSPSEDVIWMLRPCQWLRFEPQRTNACDPQNLEAGRNLREHPVQPVPVQESPLQYSHQMAI